MYKHGVVFQRIKVIRFICFGLQNSWHWWNSIFFEIKVVWFGLFRFHGIKTCTNVNWVVFQRIKVISFRLFRFGDWHKSDSFRLFRFGDWHKADSFRFDRISHLKHVQNSTHKQHAHTVTLMCFGACRFGLMEFFCRNVWLSILEFPICLSKYLVANVLAQYLSCSYIVEIFGSPFLTWIMIQTVSKNYTSKWNGHIVDT